MTNSRIGALIGPNDVEDAILATLRTWLPLYLYEIEQDNELDEQSLRSSGAGAGNAASYRGGIDFELWQEDELPVVIAVVKPIGRPERSASAGIGQAYDVQVAVIYADTESEHISRRQAAYYGVAIQGAILQQGGLGDTLAELVETRLENAPATSFRDPDERRLVECTTGFRVFVQPIVDDQLGLYVAPPPAPPFGDWPTVETTSVTITAEPIQ